MKTGLCYLPSLQYSRSYWDHRLSRKDSRYIFLPHAATFKIESDSKISTIVPSGGRKGLAMLTVTTASGEVSKTLLVK